MEFSCLGEGRRLEILEMVESYGFVRGSDFLIRLFYCI